ncbi:succinate--CoA ligase subunit beta [Wolbachia pipientis]|uniref:Succinate--CoA ligase [ADP-forming] subunit beta n=1 Tax=Wolbachia pipientis TaxID=955 RepID=A0A1E7QJ68_WOLPI|nr:ADP-forming succinate--CoA ligase subunit beta [Wolbachia pipientis]OEY86510.1 succinate--CoA ligase subunit beta [Wolbachia pipientis]
MNIHEYQAKEILRKFHVPVPKGFIVTSSEEVESQISQLQTDIFVVKAQIHAGGRGKAGGVRLAKSIKEVKQFVHDMLHSTLITHQTSPMGQCVRKVYIEAGSSIKKEYYLSLVIDSSSGKLTFVFSSEGGMDIEEVAINFPSKVTKISIDLSSKFRICDDFGLHSKQVEKINDIAHKMYEAFIATDASQIEINPLVETSSGDFIALDAKMNFDDNALYRHPEIIALRDYDEEVKEEVEASQYGLSYIKMDGNIGCMVNGAGLAMATMDIIKYYNAEPANFLDVGGNASKETVTEALKIILSDNKVKGVLVNIFGGIMRCDIIAHGIIEATKEMRISLPLVVRLSGTNFEEGKRILENSGLNIIAADGLDDAARKIVKEVSCLS